MRINFIALLLIAFIVSVDAMDKKEALEVLANGNTMLAEENYAEAIALYEPLAEDFRSVQLFHNLSLAYFHSGDLGRSILFMERASKIKPLQKDVKRNLSLLRENIESDISRISPFFLRAWMNTVSSLGGVSFWIIFHLLSLFAATYLLYLYLIKKVDFGLHFYYIRGAIIGVFVLSLIFAAFAFNRHQGIYHAEDAIVLVKEETLRMGAESNSQEVMKISEGLKVRVEDEIGAFYKVKLEDYTEGWLLKSSVERI